MDRPERMYQRDRKPVPEFLPDEPLYRAIAPVKSFLSDRLYPAVCIQLPKCSVNRGLFSEPEDVVVGRPRHGILKFLRADIPPHFTDEQATEILFEVRLKHTPEEDNYAHSDICLCKDGVCCDTKPPRVARKRWRELFARNLNRDNILKQPAFEAGAS